MALLALGTIPGITAMSTVANAAVTVGSNISVFPNRDMVVAVGYPEGATMTVDVVRDGVVIGTTTGLAAETPEGSGLEVNHGPLGTPLPGDCWNNFTPDIIGGDVIRVTTAAGIDTMTVQDVAFSGPPVLEADGTVTVSGTANPATDFVVEFRRDKPDPRFRRGPFVPVFEAGTNNWKATFRPTATSAEGLTADQQRQIALTEASWLAVADNITETTLAELGEPGGVGPGCNGSDDPNTLVGGLEPINIASGDVTFSGTARAGVTAVSVTVGGLGARDAVVTPAANPDNPSTWTLPVSKLDLATLPDGNVPVTPRFDGLAGAARNVLKDTVAPLAPSPSVAPGTYSTTQSVVLNKPAGEAQSKVYWEIGNTAVPDPDGSSNLYTAQISITSTQTLKGRLIDAAGNLGAVGTFDYRIGNPPPAPTGLTATESTTAAGAATLRWTLASGATGYNVYRNDVKLNTSPLPSTATTYTDTAAGLGDHSYVVRAVEANGIESVNSNVASVTIAAPAVPSGLSATRGDAQVTLRWTAATDVANYRVYRDGVALPSLVAGSASSYTNTGLTNGTLYEYALAALDAGGNESARTGIVQAVPADLTPPPAPAVTPASATYTSAQSVSMSTTEAGAVIRYTVGATTAGTPDPTVTDVQYTAPLTVGSSQVVKAAAFDAAGNRSTVVTRTYTINIPDTTPPPVPTVTPLDGTYTTVQTVQATNTEAGVVHRYTVSTTGVAPADPTATSTQLPAAGLQVSQSSIVKVRSFDAAGNGSTPAVTRTYTVNLPDTTPPPAPSVTPATGTYAAAQTVTATSTEAGVTHRYTVATGTTAPADPTGTDTALPAAGLAVSATSVVKVASFDAAGNRSPIVTRTLTIDTVAPPAPAVNPATGSYTGTQTVTATNTETGVTHRYTVGAGTTVPADPTTASTALPAAGLPVSTSSVVKVAAFDAVGNRSAVTQRNYTIAGTRTVVLNPTADTMARNQAATTASGSLASLKSDTQETDGNTATRATSYLQFTVPTLAAGESITGAELSLLVSNGTANGPQIWRTATGWSESTLTWNAGQPTRSGTAAVGNFGSMAVARVSTPVSGVTTGAVSFQLYADASDGMDFASRENTTVANRPQLIVTISTGGTTPVDTVAPPAPTVNPATGTYTTAQSVTMANTEAGAVIRYTVGTGTTVPADPTATSPQYTGAINVSASQVIKAAAFDAAGNRSTIVQRNYTISTGTGGIRTVTLNAAADTYVHQGQPTTSFGAAPVLFVDSEFTSGNINTRTTAYLRFTIPALAAGESIAGANLRLNLPTTNADSATANGPAIWRTDTTWTEGTMTWNTGRPARTGTAAVGNFGSMALGPVTTSVSGITAAGTVSFELAAEATDGLQFNSKESTAPPQLVVSIRTP